MTGCAVRTSHSYLFDISVTKDLTLSYVPVTKHTNPIRIIMKFLIICEVASPSEGRHSDTSSITGGIRSASVLEHIAPIREMTKFRCGTSSEIVTAM